MNTSVHSLKKEKATWFGNQDVDLSKTKFWGCFEEPREQRELQGVSLQQPESLMKQATVAATPRQVISIWFIATVLVVSLIGWFLVWLWWGTLPRPIF